MPPLLLQEGGGGGGGGGCTCQVRDGGRAAHLPYSGPCPLPTAQLPTPPKLQLTLHYYNYPPPVTILLRKATFLRIVHPNEKAVA